MIMSNSFRGCLYRFDNGLYFDINTLETNIPDSDLELYGISFRESKQYFDEVAFSLKNIKDIVRGE